MAGSAAAVEGTHTGGRPELSWRQSPRTPEAGAAGEGRAGGGAQRRSQGEAEGGGGGAVARAEAARPDRHDGRVEGAVGGGAMCGGLDADGLVAPLAGGGQAQRGAVQAALAAVGLRVAR